MTQSERGASQLAGAVSQNGRALCNGEWARPYNPFVLPRVLRAVTALRSGKAANPLGMWDFVGAVTQGRPHEEPITSGVMKD